MGGGYDFAVVFCLGVGLAVEFRGCERRGNRKPNFETVCFGWVYWESHINWILFFPDLNFKCTTHHLTIYSITFHGLKVLLLCQVDNFSLASPSEDIAKVIYDIIGTRIRLPGEQEPPFKYMRLVDDYNSIQVEQSSNSVSITAAKYIDRVLKTHAWDQASPHKATSKHKAIPFLADLVPFLYKEKEPLEDTLDHVALAEKQGFLYCSRFGKLVYA